MDLLVGLNGHHEDDGPKNYATSDTETASERASSPKSDSSVSELSEASSLSLEFSDNVSEEGGGGPAPHQDILLEDLAALKLEEDAEEMAKQGADVRHVLQTSWKLQSKYPVGKKILNNKSSGLNRTAPGAALREMAEAQKLSIEEHERIARLLKSNKRFERSSSMFNPAAASALKVEEPPILVSYADGSNSLTLANEPLCLHDITVSCAVDACHMFIQQVNNPTFVGLEPLEEDMAVAYKTEEPAAAPLLRPIATGSLLAVYSDEKWYRCQVVAYNERLDTCEVKFVDHGGYTTVQVDELRQLRTDFIRLPFQAIEVYIAHVGPANDEVAIDIAADILFRKKVSVQLCGFAEDGVAVVQAYFYHRDYINLFDQTMLNDAYRVFRENHPEYTPVPTPSSLMSDTSSEYSSGESNLACESEIDFTTSDEGVWSDEVEAALHSPASSSLVYSPQPCETPAVALYPAPQPELVYSQVAPGVFAPEGPQAHLYSPEQGLQYGDVSWVSYYVPDPATGNLFLVTAPVVPAPQELLVPSYQEPVPYLEPVESCQEQLAADQTNLKPVELWTQEDYENYYSSHE